MFVRGWRGRFVISSYVCKTLDANTCECKRERHISNTALKELETFQYCQSVEIGREIQQFSVWYAILNILVFILKAIGYQATQLSKSCHTQIVFEITPATGWRRGYIEASTNKERSLSKVLQKTRRYEADLIKCWKGEKLMNLQDIQEVQLTDRTQ